jgi:hypothetical protein
MDSIKQKYFQLCDTPSDINEHLPTLFEYTKKCSSVLELGVRGCVSSYAFASGLISEDNENTGSKLLVLNDVSECNIAELLNYSEKIRDKLDIQWFWINDLDLQLDRNIDLTFIDTWHVYGQLKRELDKFSKITKKYIIMHDTTLDGVYGETIRSNWNAQFQSEQTGIPVDEINKGLQPAIDEFLESHGNWKVEETFTHNNGLTILKRIE